MVGAGRLVRLRLCGTLLLVGVALCLSWLPGSLNGEAPDLALPFLAAGFLTARLLVLTVVNNWRWAAPVPRPVPIGGEEPVVVLVPTYDEPVAMVARARLGARAELSGAASHRRRR